MRCASVADCVPGTIKLLHCGGLADWAKEWPGQPSNPYLIDHALAHATLRYKPRQARRNSTRNVGRASRRDGEDKFCPPPCLRLAKIKSKSSRASEANKQQTNNIALAVFISFISYDLLK
jgi:hypothetical protein